VTAVGLLCREYLQGWGPKNVRLHRSIENHLQKHSPDALKSVYYQYYATQALHHVGGAAWKQWNDKMRDLLISTQDKSDGPNRGSWSSAGDPHSAAGGRLMITSLSLLTLEVYYRHLPLHGNK
jgi:hypothetical protein